MKPLRVALVVKPVQASYVRDDKLSGLFSYAVPEFIWHHHALGNNFMIDTRHWQGRYDLVFHLDGGSWGIYTGPLPVVYYSIDSTLSEDHFEARYQQARQARLVLVDQGDLARFQTLRHPVIQFPYCVNDRLFRPFEYPASKIVDVGWYAHNKGIGGEARQAAAAAVYDHCYRRGYTCRIKTVLDPLGYALALAGCRIIVNWPRTPSNRPYRVFDTMACRTCLVTRRLPDIPEDHLIDGLNCLQGDTVDDLCRLIDEAMAGDRWRAIAETGYQTVMAHHTWAVRARQLRALIDRLFPGLGE